MALVSFAPVQGALGGLLIGVASATLLAAHGFVRNCHLCRRRLICREANLLLECKRAAER
eukprot:scaffold20108_cov37-Prasinocladus_malaysianus.AAC.1